MYNQIPWQYQPRSFQSGVVAPSFPPGGEVSILPFNPGGGPGFPGGGTPPFIPGTGQGGVPSQLSQGNLTTLLSSYSHPVGQPSPQTIFLYNLLKGNPTLLQSFIQQQPQSLSQGLQFAQTGTPAPRDPSARVLPSFCYNRWSLVFTYNDVYLMWPSANLFGYVIGYFYPYLTPGLLPSYQVLFALC